MALTYRSVAGLEYDGTAPAVGKPSGLAVGDTLVIGARVSHGSATMTPGITYSDTMGPVAMETGFSRIFAWAKIADSADVAASTFGFTCSVSSRVVMSALAYSGGDSGDAVDAFATVGPVETGSPTAPSATATVADTVAVLFHASNSSRTITANPSGWTLRQGVGSPLWEQLYVFTYPHTASGASPATGYTLASADHTGRITVLLKPAGGGGGAAAVIRRDVVALTSMGIR